ncbi:HYAL2 protein, partial [Polypterus senegalus]|nr:HYAL2 protein [Polypterus senegalus]
MIHWRSFMVAAFLVGTFGQVLKQTSKPIISSKPVLLAWNVPSQGCSSNYSVNLNLQMFDVVAPPNKVGQQLAIFYNNRLGLYPYYNSQNQSVNGGIPQEGILSNHLAQMTVGLNKYIPDAQSPGLAVIDWEYWNPLWNLNFGPKTIYQTNSINLVKTANPSWNQSQLRLQAKQDFEKAARDFMQQTLITAERLCPNRLWGFYLFPDCYNYFNIGNQQSYTGICTSNGISESNQLGWLWQQSTALYPSIYLNQLLASTEGARQFVRNRVKQAMTVASNVSGLARPVFVYSQPVYETTQQLLSQTDLIYTIGESVALGVAGVVLWGGTTNTAGLNVCTMFQSYLQGELGRYLLNVSTAAEQCSQTLCNGNGRCVRLNSDSNTYLHLNPNSFQVTQAGGTLQVTGTLSAADKAGFQANFGCQCYSPYNGTSCQFSSKSSACTALYTTLALGLFLLFLIP